MVTMAEPPGSIVSSAGSTLKAEAEDSTNSLTGAGMGQGLCIVTVCVCSRSTSTLPKASAASRVCGPSGGPNSM